MLGAEDRFLAGGSMKETDNQPMIIIIKEHQEADMPKGK